MESPEDRAARLGALAADREREILDLDRLNKVAKAQRASEEAAYKKLVADRAKEQAAWDQKLADSKRKLDSSEDALRRTTLWNKKLEADRNEFDGEVCRREEEGRRRASSIGYGTDPPRYGGKRSAHGSCYVVGRRQAASRPAAGRDGRLERGKEIGRR